MEHKKNSFGDIAIVYETGRILPNVDYQCKNNIIISGPPIDFIDRRLSHLIGKTKVHGNIFGNIHASKNFPMLLNDMTQGECTVMFVKYKDSVFVILVQMKRRPYLMNIAGFMNRSDKCLQDTVIRDIFEEMGLIIDVKKWKPLAEWKFDLNFAGLPFIGYTLCGFYWLDKVPLNWNINEEDKVNIIPIEDNNEIESIVLINISVLSQYEELFKNKTIPTKINSHHFNLVLKAAIKEHLIHESLKSLQQPVLYLKEFSDL